MSPRDLLWAVLALVAIRLATLLLFRLLAAAGVRAPRIAQDLLFSALVLVWLVAVLRAAGFDPAQIFATSALLTAVLAFAMQDTLGNVLGGVALQLDHSLRVGDWVEVDGFSGQVTDVRWRYTAIRQRDGQTVIVPNSWLMKNRFAVLRADDDGRLPAWRRALAFEVDARHAPSQVLAVLAAAAHDACSAGAITTLAAEPAPDAVLMDTRAGQHHVLLRYWLADPSRDDGTDSALRVHALAALARAGIDTGLPRAEHLLVKENERWSQANAQREHQRQLDAVARTALFAGLSPAEREALAAHLVHAPFVAGDIVTREGAVAHWLYLIVSGRARVSVGPDGAPHAVAELADGDFFGEMGMLTGEPRRATVTALTDIDCYRLDKAGFAEVLQQRPDIAHEVTAILAQRAADLARERSAAGEPVPPAPAAGDLLGRIRQFFGLGE